MYRFCPMDVEQDLAEPEPATATELTDKPPAADAPGLVHSMADNISPQPSSVDKVAQGIAELQAMAFAKAPRCSGGEPCSWLTISQASRALGIQKSILSNWATKGYIAVVKGNGKSDHRLIHLMNCLSMMSDSIRSAAARADGEDVDSAPDSPNPPSPGHSKAAADGAHQQRVCRHMSRSELGSSSSAAVARPTMSATSPM